MDLQQHAPTVASQLPAALVGYLRGEVRPLTDAECELFFAVGASLYSDERYADAADMFRALVLGRPESVRAWTCLAMCHDAVEDFERANALYDIATRAPLDEGYQNRARVYHARTLFWLERFDELAATLDAIEESALDDDLAALCDELRTELDAHSRGRR